MKNNIQKYQQLLVEEESLESFDAVLDLVTDTFLVEFSATLENENFSDSDLIDNWVKGSEFYGEVNKEELYKILNRNLKVKEKKEINIRVLKATAILSSLPSAHPFTEPSNNIYSFCMDVLILFFHHSYFGLLPKIQSRDWSNEKSTLLHSFLNFSNDVPDDSEKYRIRGLVYYAIGDYEKTFSFFKAALQVTHTDEHDYMTRLQTLWMLLLEMHEFKLALELLLSLYSSITREHLDEFNELIRHTFIEQENFLKKVRKHSRN